MLVLQDNSPESSHVSACFVSKGIDIFLPDYLFKDVCRGIALEYIVSFLIKGKLYLLSIR